MLRKKKNYIYFFNKKKYLVIKLFLYNFLENNNYFCHLKINIVVIFYTLLIIFFWNFFKYSKLLALKFAGRKPYKPLIN